MLYKILTYSFCVFCLLGIGLLIFPIKQSDYTLYHQLVKSSNSEAPEPLFSYSTQKREGVCKEVWYQDEDPLYLRIDSEESELFFFRQNHQIEVIEQLGKVKCIMQEELYYLAEQPMQKIRYLEAETACYHYHSQLFVAEDVKIWKYALPGHTPPKTISLINPLMQAVAKSVEFTFKGENFDFIAHQMKAIMNSQDRSL